MKKKIVTFGELLLRFSKDDHRRLTQGDIFTSKYGGSEANVAVSLATLGDQVEYVTRLPATPVGRAGVMRLQELGVNCHHVLFGGDRIGTYYFEPAAGMRSAKVIYDRSHSAYSELQPGMIPWREILKDASVLHVSGITAAISQNAADATFEALDIADEMGVLVSYDINYRKNLWKYGAEPRTVLKQMLSRCDMMFGDAIEFEWICQRSQPPFTATDTKFEMQMKEYGEWFDDLHAEFPRCRKWLMGMRNMVASSRHLLTALLWTDGELLKAPIMDINGVVDPSGVGDAFMAGLLHSIQAYPDDPQLQLNYSLAASTLKNTIPGDFNLATDDEITSLL
ncbi:MAG: sugar kinase [Prevotella sp.]|jgi:2-dehydro-3-deoxygluconokinase|nr:sugar kinase [Prevotella sp.]